MESPLRREHTTANHKHPPRCLPAVSIPLKACDSVLQSRARLTAPTPFAFAAAEWVNPCLYEGSFLAPCTTYYGEPGWCEPSSLLGSECGERQGGVPAALMPAAWREDGAAWGCLQQEPGGKQAAAVHQPTSHAPMQPRIPCDCFCSDDADASQRIRSPRACSAIPLRR